MVVYPVANQGNIEGILNLKHWYFMGIYIKAEISYSTGGSNRRLEHFKSSGLWGIESDAGNDYIKQVERQVVRQ